MERDNDFHAVTAEEQISLPFVEKDGGSDE